MCWQARNEKILRGVVLGPEEIFDRIQVVSYMEMATSQEDFFTMFMLSVMC
jgi:hypothetical protein